jgi:hypothetical protein
MSPSPEEEQYFILDDKSFNQMKQRIFLKRASSLFVLRHHFKKTSEKQMT